MSRRKDAVKPELVLSWGWNESCEFFYELGRGKDDMGRTVGPRLFEPEGDASVVQIGGKLLAAD